MPVNIAITGFSGRVGSLLLNIISKDIRFNLIQLLTRDKSKYLQHPNSSIIANLNEISDNVEIIIDFSNSDFTMQLLEYARNIPIVIATTGFSDAQKEIILTNSQSKPILISSNMSISVNILFSLASLLSSKLPNFEVEIIETHHRNKLDAPSGTALTILENIKKNKPNVFMVTNRANVGNTRKSNEVGISSVRAGNIVGKHEVLFVNDSEQISIISEISDRDCFARGAILGALYLLNQNSGIYSMQDVLFGNGNESS